MSEDYPAGWLPTVNQIREAASHRRAIEIAVSAGHTAVPTWAILETLTARPGFTSLLSEGSERP